jgi:CRP/FNR family transcriptional regulator
MDESLTIANYSLDLITSRFSELMWLMQQIMWKSFDKRLAKFLL